MTQSRDSALGPSNSSDSGSDRAGATRQPGLPDPLTPVDKATREGAPRSALPEEVMSIETDKTGTALDVTPDPEPDQDRDDDEGGEHEPAEHEPHPTSSPGRAACRTPSDRADAAADRQHDAAE